MTFIYVALIGVWIMFDDVYYSNWGTESQRNLKDDCKCTFFINGVSLSLMANLSVWVDASYWCYFIPSSANNISVSTWSPFVNYLRINSHLFSGNKGDIFSNMLTFGALWTKKMLKNKACNTTDSWHTYCWYVFQSKIQKWGNFIFRLPPPFSTYF